MSCIVYGCPNNNFPDNDTTIQYYTFPKHPLIAQQWIDVTGWQPEHIDTAIAKICSIHFSEDSYTTEIKVIDFMTCYTKILKYDAIPSLYLPTTQIVIKEAVEVSEEDGLSQMIVFTVPSTTSNQEAGSLNLNCPPNQQFSSNSKEYIELQVHTLTPSCSGQTNNLATNSQNQDLKMNLDENAIAAVDMAKYNKIETQEQLKDLENRNRLLREKIISSGYSIKNFKKFLENHMDLYKKNDMELCNIRREYSRVRQKVLSLSEQKSLLLKVFSESQIKILSGKKKIYWSNDDMAVGYTIRHLSNRRCYIYLTKKLNIPLPAVSSIKRWMTLKSAPKKSLQAVEVKKDEDKDSD